MSIEEVANYQHQAERELRQASIEAEMQRRRDSDYHPLTDREILNILHTVLIEMDKKIDRMQAEIHTLHRIVTGEPERLREGF